VTSTAAISDPPAAAAFPPRVKRVFAVHFIACIGVNLLVPGFFFYAKLFLHWTSQPSLMLSAGEGIFYVSGSLLASRLSKFAGRRRTLIVLQAFQALLAAACWIHPTPAFLVVMLLLYTLASSSCWPNFESLIAAGAGAHLLSRRIGVYNLIWSSVGALTLAVTGTIIEHFSWGIFAIPVAAHLLALTALLGKRAAPSGEEGASEHPAAEPGLLRQRKLALLLSRLSMPATYVVVWVLIALMPSLHVIQSFSVGVQTIVASVWMGSRFLTFLWLGRNDWWHTRPRVLLVAATAMLVSFLGVTLSWAPVTPLEQTLMIGWQVILGVAMGLIYSASLYFGMVLSDGSAEQGGYHEALIGVGQIIGPTAALAAEQLSPGDNRFAVFAAAGIVLATLLTACAITVRQSSREE
jgi:MFS family permease